MQKKCISFCQRLDKMHHISEEDFRSINWLPTSKWVNQCISTTQFKFLNKIFEFASHCRIGRRNKLTKNKILSHKTNMGQKAISFSGSSLWNSLPELIKKTDYSNTFKQNFENYCLNWINNELMKSHCYVFKDLTILTYIYFLYLEYIFLFFFHLLLFLEKEPHWK